MEQIACLDTPRALAVTPVQWSMLRDIDEVEPLNNSDVPALREIREVLQRHGLTERFGVALLHSHFELGDNEVMVETADPVGRTLTLQPVHEKDVGGSVVGTIWMLRDDPVHAMAWCRRFCERSFLGHFKMHNREGR